MIGDTRTVPCSWCGEMVTEVLRRYPPSSGVTGLYWDCSACPCGSLQGILALSRDRTMQRMGRKNRGASP